MSQPGSGQPAQPNVFEKILPKKAEAFAETAIGLGTAIAGLRAELRVQAAKGVPRSLLRTGVSGAILTGLGYGAFKLAREASDPEVRQALGSYGNMLPEFKEVGKQSEKLQDFLMTP